MGSPQEKLVPIKKHLAKKLDVFFFPVTRHVRCFKATFESQPEVAHPHKPLPFPIGSMGLVIFPYIWLICMVNVGKYTLHGSYGFDPPFSGNLHLIVTKKKNRMMAVLRLQALSPEELPMPPTKMEVRYAKVPFP